MFWHSRDEPRCGPSRLARARFAAKTVVAAVVGALCFARAPRAVELLAALSAAFVTQFIAGPTRAAQGRVLLGSGLVLALLAAAAAAMAPPPAHLLGREVLVAAVAFAIFPIRALLPGRPMFPMFGFTTVLLVTALAPGTPAVCAGCVLFGVAVAFALHFLPGGLEAPPVDLPLAGRPDPPRSGVAQVDTAASTSALTANDFTLGVRCASATLLSALVGHAFRLQRPYWIELTAVVLVTATWRETAKKAVERVLATALGCAVGWLLRSALAASPPLVRVVLFACVFLAVYVRPVSYARMMFFISVYVVLLFSITGRWTIEIATARIVDTAIGAAIAVAVLLPRTRGAAWTEKKT